MNAIDKCIPKTQGQHPGEWHAACVSWIDSTSGAVMVSVRHVATGHVSQVEIGDVVFGDDAQTYFDTRPAVVSSAPIPSAPSLTAPARVISSTEAKLQVQCAWCRQWKVGDAWADLPKTGAVGAVTHGICPACSVKMLAEVAA